MDKLAIKSEEVPVITGELATLFRVLSKADTPKILSLAGMGIENSTYAIKELAITPKRYYARRKELVDTGLVRKMDGVYRQTTLGRYFYDHLLPEMGKVVDAREKIAFLDRLERTEIDSGVRKRIFEELRIPSFFDPTKIKLLGDYEALAIEAIDLYDSAEESVLLATNYFDVRVIEATLRAVDRGVKHRTMMGKNSTSSSIQKLKGMLSMTFTKALINFASNIVELKDRIRYADVPYTFCIVDGHRNLIEISNTLNDNLIVALSIDDRIVAEKLTKFYETIWETGEANSTLKVLNSLKSS